MLWKLLKSLWGQPVPAMSGPARLEDMTWRCHICDRSRPDPKISVVTHDRTPPSMPAGTIKENVRYCNDNPECEAAARVAKSRLG
jgi:hypothetical protein